MGDTILGPPGVLPPGECAVGARVECGPPQTGGWPCVIAYQTPGLLWVASRLPQPDRVDPIRTDSDWWFRLDLTTGPLDFGTRALLALVAPDVEQPLTAPGWERFGNQWTLTIFHGDGFDSKWRFTGGGIYHGYHRVADTPEAMLEEAEPRRSLQMALAAMASNRPVSAHVR